LWRIVLSAVVRDAMCNGRCLTCVAGFLTGAYKSAEDFEEGDFRRYTSRFQGEAFKENLKLIDALK
jgi:aryl-alcohol dehydrogenase-like predicted oxidoreductase